MIARTCLARNPFLTYSSLQAPLKPPRLVFVCGGGQDTRPDEHARMGTSGWMGRLKRAAQALDLWLKACPLQTVCHGDAKGANIMYATGAGGEAVPLVYDFQYCGKACAAKVRGWGFESAVRPCCELVAAASTATPSASRTAGPGLLCKR